MRKASTGLLEQGTQTPSPAPDLIPAETKINRELTLGLVQQMGALHRTLSLCLFWRGLLTKSTSFLSCGVSPTTENPNPLRSH